MELIERYVHAVGRRIPKKIRADIEKELKSLILDQLDAKTKGQEPTEEDIIFILKDMGHPAHVAAKYNNQDRGLIGPRLIDTYYLIIKIVLGAVAFGLLVATAIQIAQTPAETGMLFLKLLGQLVSAALSEIGAVTIVFAIIERTAPAFKEFDLHGKDWNPKDLPPVTKPVDQIKPSESIVALVFIVFAIVIFNFFYDKFGIYHMPQGGGQLSFIPFIEKSAYLTYLPFWNALWALEFIRHLSLLILGKEVLATRIYGLIIPVFSIFVISFMLAGPSILATNIAQPDFIEWPSKVFGIFYIIYRVVLILALIGTLADIGKRIYALIKSLR